MGQETSAHEAHSISDEELERLSGTSGWSTAHVKILHSWFQQTCELGCMQWMDFLGQIDAKKNLPLTFSSRVFSLALCLVRKVPLVDFEYQLKEALRMREPAPEDLEEKDIRQTLLMSYQYTEDTEVLRAAMRNTDAAYFERELRRSEAERAVSAWAGTKDVRNLTNRTRFKELDRNMEAYEELHEGHGLSFEEFLAFLKITEKPSAEDQLLWIFSLFEIHGRLWPGQLLKVGRFVASALLPSLSSEHIVDSVHMVFGGKVCLQPEEFVARMGQLRAARMRKKRAGGNQDPSAGSRKKKKKRRAKEEHRGDPELVADGFGLFSFIHEYSHALKSRSAAFIARGRLWVGRHRRYVRVEGNSLVISKDKDSMEDTEVIRLVEARVVQRRDKPYRFEVVLRDGRTLSFRAATEAAGNAWCNAILTNVLVSASRFRFDSFAPVRADVLAKWYVDGRDYYMDVMRCLQRASSEILITDWSMSPEVYLDRDVNPGNATRLDNILEERAAAGVQVYILLWFEVAQGGQVDSQHVVDRFFGCPNIHVQRHPTGLVSRWSHHQKSVVVDRTLAFVGGVDLCYGRYDDTAHTLVDDCYLQMRHPGKDFYNPSIAPTNEFSKPFADPKVLNRLQHPRQPWHDIHSGMDGAAARDVARNFVQRWNAHMQEGTSSGPMLAPVRPVELPHKLPRVLEAGGSRMQAQVLRSLAKWSGAQEDMPETSIYECYRHMIEQAEHFVYIENQYFISSIGPVQNQIAAAIVARILRAIEEDKTFRVVVVLPLYPEGDFRSSPSRILFNYAHKTIRYIRHEILKEHPTVDVDDYFNVSTLVNHARIGARFFVQMIYVHSKLLIVDDRVAMISSANVNDRSMAGDHDSELGVYFESEGDMDVVMDGVVTRGSRFAHTLRVNLWQEHLGLSDTQLHLIKDPISKRGYETMWRGIAEANEKLIEPIVEIKAEDVFVSLARGYGPVVERKNMLRDVFHWVHQSSDITELQDTCACCTRISQPNVLPCCECGELTCRQCVDVHEGMTPCHTCRGVACGPRETLEMMKADFSTLGGAVVTEEEEEANEESHTTTSEDDENTVVCNAWLERVASSHPRYLRVFCALTRGGAIKYYSGHHMRRHVGGLITSPSMSVAQDVADDLQFSVRDAQHVFTFLADSTQERDVWVNAIAGVLSARRKERGHVQLEEDNEDEDEEEFERRRNTGEVWLYEGIIDTSHTFSQTTMESTSDDDEMYSIKEDDFRSVGPDKIGGDASPDDLDHDVAHTLRLTREEEHKLLHKFKAAFGDTAQDAQDEFHDAVDKTRSFLVAITHTRVERRLSEVRGHLVPYPINEKVYMARDLYNIMKGDPLFL